MPLSGKTERKLRKMFAADGGNLTVGLFGMARLDTGDTTPGSLRVAMTRNEICITLSPTEARLMAKRFDAPEAVKAGVSWIGESLREVADEIDAKIKRHN